jgi:hypothetical protein
MTISLKSSDSKSSYRNRKFNLLYAQTCIDLNTKFVMHIICFSSFD